MSFRKIIHSEVLVEEFVYNYLPDLGKDEVYFLSLSARNKYLTKEEREEFSLGRTEMFARTIVRSKDKFLQKLRQYEGDERGYVTKNGKPIPSKALVCYVNINPCSAVVAAEETITKLQSFLFDHLRSGGSSNVESFKKMDLTVMNAFQRSTGTRYYVDLDFDIPKYKESFELFTDSLRELTEKGLRYFVVETKGGFHVVVHKESITYNYVEHVKGIQDRFRERFPNIKLEVVVNRNAMIPVPGTFQGDYEVKKL